MALPQTQGWLVDYVTAKNAFENGDNTLIHALVEMCETGALYFCSCEDHDFRRHGKLRPPFIDDNDCRVDLSEAIIVRMVAIMHAYQGKPFVVGDRSTKVLVATALEYGYGIISDRSSPAFAVPRDLALALNVAVLTTGEFKSLL